MNASLAVAQDPCDIGEEEDDIKQWLSEKWTDAGYRHTMHGVYSYQISFDGCNMIVVEKVQSNKGLEEEHIWVNLSVADYDAYSTSEGHKGHGHFKVEFKEAAVHSIEQAKNMDYTLYFNHLKARDVDNYPMLEYDSKEKLKALICICKKK